MKELWFDRAFPLGLPIERLPALVERLRGAPPRVEEKTRGLSSDALTRRRDGAWSIQENVGHLLDLEALWRGRVEDFAAERASLRPADLANEATWKADHNARSIAEILAEFRSARSDLVASLSRLEPRVLAHAAVHPRLRSSMHLVDLVFFVCEHDDHHLARIEEMRAS